MLEDNLGNQFYWGVNGTPTPANSTTQYIVAAGIQENASGGVSGISLPQGLVMNAGWYVVFTTLGLDGGDQWSNIALTFAG